VEQQKGRQEDSEPSFFVAGGQEGVDSSQHFWGEFLVDALVPYAVKLGNNHPWEYDPVRIGMIGSRSPPQPQVLLAAEQCCACSMSWTQL
jgi:hypothetical protein